jgi:DNA invertase Pin-like site-specific DNA recombinase
MARKSRKQNNQMSSPRHVPMLIQTAAYVRLSSDDRNKKGDSIETQKQIISNYIDDQPDLELYDTYVDSNISGTTFERPNFHRLLRDAESGKVSCVIVKDLSRLGRNMIDTGYYTEQVFPRLGLRLISIGDNYDSITYQGDISIPFTHLINETYAFDIGRKRKASAQQAMIDGVYVGGHPPYGYLRSPDNRRKLVVDASAAEIVKQIFEWTADGVSTYEIARKLNAKKISSPNAHKNENPETTGRWYARTIEGILENEIYLGNLIQGKTKTIHFQRQPVSPDEWICAYDTHEVIISPEMFQTVKTFRAKKREISKRKPTASYSPNIYKGKIYCAHCGGHMERRKNHDKYVFHCVARRTMPGSCDGNRIREDAVAAAFSEQLLRFREDLSYPQNVPSNETEVLPELRFIGMELFRLQNLTRSLYESLVTGLINQTEYSELKCRYQNQTDEHTQRTAVLQQILDDEKAANKRNQESLRILDAFADTRLLTADYVERFFDRVIVYRDGRLHWEVVG